MCNLLYICLTQSYTCFCDLICILCKLVFMSDLKAEIELNTCRLGHGLNFVCVGFSAVMTNSTVPEPELLWEFRILPYQQGLVAIFFYSSFLYYI